MNVLILYRKKLKELALEEYILIRIIELAIAIDFIVLVFNKFAASPQAVILNFIFLICLLLIYYIALFKHQLKVAFVGFIVSIILLLTFAWFFNHGIMGDASFFFISMTIAFSIILKIKNKILIPIGVLLFFGGLITLEWYQPTWVIFYDNELNHKINMIFSTSVNIFLVYHIVNILKKEYEVNRKSLEKISDDLSEKNKILEANELKLHSQNENLQQLNQTKNRLFSLISHDLRSPLAGIQGLIELAYKGDFSVEQIKDLLPEMHQSLSYTVSLLDNLLFWSKSQLYSYEPEVKKLDIAETIRKYFLPNLQIMAKDKQIKINLKFQIHHALGLMDYNILEIVTRNICSNAIKFSPSHSEIDIILEDYENFVNLKFTDQGVGMNPHHIDKIYKGVLFTTKGTSNEKGVGIGLNLCLELLQKCNSTLEIESELTKGTTVIIKIPKAILGQ
ncbi:MAG: ATP-binding protein [Raineya sp.]|jgi:signal transduction histidine kinase|nr:ATP-binding protein [Raineya sp.]